MSRDRRAGSKITYAEHSGWFGCLGSHYPLNWAQPWVGALASYITISPLAFRNEWDSRRKEQWDFEVRGLLLLIVNCSSLLTPPPEITLWPPLALPVLGRILYASKQEYCDGFSRISPNDIVHRVVILNLAALVSIQVQVAKPTWTCI